MSKLLYLTENKPSRKSSREFIVWLEANYPDCSFTEVNVGKQSHPGENRGRYQGRVEAPAVWGDMAHAPQRQAIFDAARRLLAE